jgi:hypothetical protein
MLLDLDLVNLICNILSAPCDAHIQEATILVGISLLSGGNIKAQMEFYQFIKRNVSNNFLLRIVDVLNENFNDIETNMKATNDLDVTAIINEGLGSLVPTLKSDESNGDIQVGRSSQAMSNADYFTGKTRISERAKEMTHEEINMVIYLLRFLQ